MGTTTRIIDSGCVSESSAQSAFSIEVPLRSVAGEAFTSTNTASAYTATRPGFYFVTGAAASGSIFTVPNPALYPGAFLSVSEIGTNQCLLSGAYAGKTFVLANGTSHGAVAVVPKSGFASFRSSGVSWCLTATSGSVTVYS